MSTSRLCQKDEGEEKKRGTRRGYMGGGRCSHDTAVLDSTILPLDYDDRHGLCLPSLTDCLNAKQESLHIRVEGHPAKSNTVVSFLWSQVEVMIDDT
jgi:hypothetical protein